jgi:hypothetical protein
MRTIYVLGAGFSKSCGIATDPEMLRALNETLPRVQSKLKSEPRTSIEHLLEQAFKRRNVGFEQFMSTLSGLNPLGINFEYRITGLRSLMLLTTAVTMSLKMETDHSVKLVKSLRVRRKLRRVFRVFRAIWRMESPCLWRKRMSMVRSQGSMPSGLS